MNVSRAEFLELKALVESLKCCGNCCHCDVDQIGQWRCYLDGGFPDRFRKACPRWKREGIRDEE